MKVTDLLKLLLLSWVSMASLRHSFCTGNSTLQLNDDVLGLIVFKSDLYDPSSALKSWNEDDNSPCPWQHIYCHPVTGRVTQITLDSLGLSGNIGRGLEKLQSLQVLSLSRNNFTGTISPEISNVSSLNRLNLSHNSLSGRIPNELASMASLKFLDLSENSLSGPIPVNMFDNLSSLRFVSFADNLLEGPIPSSLPKCSSLSGLNLSNNHLSGNPSFVNGIWSLARLRILDISHNVFSGSVPDGVSALHNLKELQLQGNQFSGSLPSDIGFCPHLSRLDLGDNLFTGDLPNLQRLNFLRFLKLSNNKLTGNFPDWIGDMSSLEYLDLAGNDISGYLPASIGDLKLLNYLILSNNGLTGEVPTSLAYCSRLSVLRLRGNGFNGSIPHGLFDLGLNEIDLAKNWFDGSIPPGSSPLFSSLQILDLSNNKLRGVIPTEMGLFSNLRYLNLSWNNLQSSLPPKLDLFQNLKVLDLRNNALYGSIPEDLCSSNSLSILQLDGNSLSGPIPEEIGNCSSLTLLSLSHNHLNGSIPKEISKLDKLTILKLELNKLSGEIPMELGRLNNLLAVNISYNRLEGRLPMGAIFQNLDQSALQGNLGICSPLLKGPCKMNSPKPLVLNPFANNIPMNSNNTVPGPSNSARIRDSRFLRFPTIIAMAAAISIVIGVIVVSLLNASARRNLSFVDTALESMCSSSQRSGSSATVRFTLFGTRSSGEWVNNPESLVNKACEIGNGVFGTVYKASLGEGRIVAIKKLTTSNIIQSPDDFDREVRILGNARHPNLITLKGYYCSPQYQLLMSDYAPSGSLQSILHERSPSSPPISWANRFKIALGTAKGLAYLHHSFNPPIIHYNIKPSNILLDENYNPKISDFGLARLLTKLDKHVINSRFQSALGYVAPELACQSLRVDEKCDIYGYGVMILELVTGRRPVEYGEDDVVILSDHVRVLLEQGNALDCVDPSMTEYPEEEVLPVLKLGLVCTSQIPSSRPSMAEVVQILHVIRTPVPQRMEMF
ncbi:probably inactive leucine-rich repeat receptor-like protein kinase At3g28040 [Macadamia integrifolia]|uniref:probably inactive leucine-rich repeat receptor-like protein kinase At3g28040 n=1 Tax=Macadamia integrifolia TaxID=60698 RepID=UPI001C4F4AA7|nr:probably inactive leucine-rich repeat receptor-like protein kinase At3g28040 [Macadamia integrifolia]